MCRLSPFSEGGVLSASRSLRAERMSCEVRSRRPIASIEGSVGENTHELQQRTGRLDSFGMIAPMFRQACRRSASAQVVSARVGGGGGGCVAVLGQFLVLASGL